ncbi:MAG: CaiB/BaiF CoA-transferase family protein [Chromatiales bacterium]|nr:CaiB/BaiF CoA-transferase family protein [Chromatiales bacterium]
MTDQGGPLDGIRVLDLSRVLAGPFCTQMLADLGAEVIKVERPGVGDETRTWGPPYVRDPDGADTTESAYYLCANRNKRSVTIDFSQPRGIALVKRLLARSDVLVENFKVGGLAKFGLGYEQLREEFPGLVYCSITGFGQTGPYAHRPGYDMMAQGMGGLISITGEPDRPPSKVPVAINDIMTGMYTAVALLSALRHRDSTGEGQQVDVGLLDVQVSWLANVASNYLVGGKIPQRLGTAHPNSVPYQVFPTEDGFIIIAANNDGQFERFCCAAGAPELLEDPHFASNALRVRNRDRLISMIEAVTRTRGTDAWMEALESAGVPCAPVNTIDRVFADPQVEARGMQIRMPHPLAGEDVRLVGSPIRLSRTPVSYRRAPPTLGQHTDEVLAEVLDLSEGERAALREEGVI